VTQGKTLSLLCATLTWLEAAQHVELNPVTAAGGTSGQDDDGVDTPHSMCIPQLAYLRPRLLAHSLWYVVYAAEPDWLRDHGANAAASAARDAALARAARRERIRKAALSVPNTGDVFAVRCPACSRPSTHTDSSHIFVGARLRAPGRLLQRDRPAPAELLV
jgi:hypothetical protein